MQANKNQASLALTELAPTLDHEPDKAALAGIKELAKLVPSLAVDFDRKGQIRALSTTSANGLIKKGAFKSPLEAACDFIETPYISKAFGLRYVTLVVVEKKEYSFGHRINFQQVAHLKHLDITVPVRGGTFGVVIDREGRIFSATSTIKRGSKPEEEAAVITADEAIARALERFDAPLSASSCRLVLSCHRGEMNLAYEVILESNSPRDVVGYLVLASSGQVVHQDTRLIMPLREAVNFEARQVTEWGALGKALLLTPDPDLPISVQVSMAVIAALPNANVLKNRYFEMFVGAQHRPVFAKQDDSYCYGIQEGEFAAVSAFIALTRQMDLYLELGLTPPSETIKVIVDDPEVEDNAYFDQLRREMHLGIGSGLKGRGLNKRIALDLGVINHEFGHAATFFQAPANDLPGSEGAALHEAIGDVMGTLVMDYLCRIWYGNLTGRQFSLHDLLTDDRIIGKYALPPGGIRCQRNTNRTPEDLTGEPHTDGLIVGGALSDLLVGMAVLPATSAEQQIRLYTRILLAAIALVPMGKVTFKDMLRALIVADYQVSGGLYRKLIIKSFLDHGIVLGTAQRLAKACTAFLASDEAQAA